MVHSIVAYHREDEKIKTGVAMQKDAQDVDHMYQDVQNLPS